jgi:hypothetical protein
MLSRWSFFFFRTSALLQAVRNRNGFRADFVVPLKRNPGVESRPRRGECRPPFANGGISPLEEIMRRSTSVSLTIALVCGVALIAGSAWGQVTWKPSQPVLIKPSQPVLIEPSQPIGRTQIPIQAQHQFKPLPPPPKAPPALTRAQLASTVQAILKLPAPPTLKPLFSVTPGNPSAPGYQGVHGGLSFYGVDSFAAGSLTDWSFPGVVTFCKDACPVKGHPFSNDPSVMIEFNAPASGENLVIDCRLSGPTNVYYELKNYNDFPWHEQEVLPLNSGQEHVIVAVLGGGDPASLVEGDMVFTLNWDKKYVPNNSFYGPVQFWGCDVSQY